MYVVQTATTNQRSQRMREIRDLTKPLPVFFSAFSYYVVQHWIWILDLIGPLMKKKCFILRLFIILKYIKSHKWLMIKFWKDVKLKCWWRKLVAHLIQSRSQSVSMHTSPKETQLDQGVRLALASSTTIPTPCLHSLT